MMKAVVLSWLASIICTLMTFAEQNGGLVLWYQQPAKSDLTEALPIGNGRLGGVVLGGVECERIQFNEDSLWTGDANPSGDENTMGAYQAFGDLILRFDTGSNDSNPVAGTSVQNYHRQLDLATATARTEFTLHGVRHVREVFASHPAQVIVIRWSADTPGAITGRIELKGAHGEPTEVNGSTLSFRGTLSNGMKYEARAEILARGGTADGGRLKRCDDVMVLLAAGTDYAFDCTKGYRGKMRALAFPTKGYDELKTEHVKDFQALFNRVSLDLGTSDNSLPTDKRKLHADPAMAALLFQYGRYLLISCSRPGGLPANLQGLWNDSNTPPWHCDYHSNINVEMNYWPAEVTNLAECHLPFFDLVRSQVPAWRKVSGAKRGFAIRTSHNITGGMGWKWDKTANAWYCQHFWEHFAFGRDRTYLRDVAYPIIKETVEYWEDHLKVLRDGRLVVPGGWSPEHGPDEDGVSYNQQIVWDLFSNYIDAANVLSVDKEYGGKILGLRDRLVGPRIGHWGQLQEWMTDRDDPNDHHRHTSHLFALFPGRQISVGKTPELARAAKASLNARGIDPSSDVREWSFAWRTALYARLHDGENAHRMLQQLFSGRNTCPNLLGLHPPMQMDGNFGITAGIAEMLVQSHEGEINLLPALPSAWPVGHVTGLRARGGFEVGLQWKDGKLEEATICSLAGQPCRLRYGSHAQEIPVQKGETITWRP
jgi:alpha-L-fucosidase 2